MSRKEEVLLKFDLLFRSSREEGGGGVCPKRSLQERWKYFCWIILPHINLTLASVQQQKGDEGLEERGR